MRNATFSAAIRNELCNLPLTNRHCVLAELSALLGISRENTRADIRCRLLLKHGFNTEHIERRVRTATEYPMAVTHTCCKRAYVRGSFIAAGTCNDPNNSYHLEYALPNADVAERLLDVLRVFGLSPKRMRRNQHAVIYLKESESIVRALTIMEAHKSMLDYENVRVLKEMRNDVNRKVNFETANLNKTVSAAIGQINDIRYINDTVGLSYLSKPLEDTAKLRLQYETASLQEIGAMLTPPVGKSGVNHRLRKISEIAEAMKQ